MKKKPTENNNIDETSQRLKRALIEFESILVDNSEKKEDQIRRQKMLEEIKKLLRDF